eukprot:2033994-Ditylum_brightwellii.AAC.1
MDKEQGYVLKDNIAYQDKQNVLKLEKNDTVLDTTLEDGTSKQNPDTSRNSDISENTPMNGIKNSIMQECAWENQKQGSQEWIKQKQE